MIVAIIVLAVLLFISIVQNVSGGEENKKLKSRNEELKIKADAFDKIHYELDNEFDEYCKPNTNLPWELYQITREAKRRYDG